MFSLQSVVTLITAAVFENIFHFQIPIGQLSSIILLLCALILFFGRYKFLDKIIKPIILILFLLFDTTVQVFHFQSSTIHYGFF